MLGLLRPQLAAGCGLVLLLATTLAPAQDTITLHRRAARSTKVLGNITQFSNTSVSIQTQQGLQEIPVKDISRINFDNEPDGLRQARTAAQGGQYEQALRDLTALSLDGNVRDVIRQEVAFFQAYARARLALQGSADPKQAAREVLDFVRRYRNTWHFYEAAELLGDLALNLDSPASANRYYAQLAAAPWPDYQLRGALLQAKVLQLADQCQEAIEHYDQVIQANLNDAEAARVKSLATLGKAACLAKLGKPEEAIPMVEEVLARHDPSDQELFARAYNALGLAYQQAEQPVDAVLAYLKVELLFLQNQDAHAEALYHLSHLWKRLNRPDRAVQASKVLHARYGGTVWAKKE